VLLKTDLATAHEQLFETIGLFQPVGKHLLLHAQVDDLRWFARQLARLDCVFDVISPPRLRTEMARHAQRLLRYSGKAPA
jgi:predicted DNA-binding transcriptional regulator YafY